MKTCSKCGVEKPLTEFSRRPQNRDGHRNCCRDCKNPTGMTHKMCSKCKAEKPLTEFHKDAGASGGFCYWCNPCQAAANRDRLLKNPDKIRAGVRKSDLKRRFGLTPEDKEALILKQKGCCALCGDPLLSGFTSHIDHIHGVIPTVIRGILCPQCNTGLGQFKDSPERLAKAITYLKKFQK